jgi:Tfp pilus assembly protein PilF
MKQEFTGSRKELQSLCNKIRTLTRQCEFEKGERLLREAMRSYPHDAEPHNLFGILLENQGYHVGAMNHFRAAWDLNPTYLQARCNLEWFGTFYSTGKCAYDETDCPVEEKHLYKVVYDNHGIGRFVKRDKDEQ